MVKSSFGHVTRSKDGYLIGKPRKNSENRYERYTLTNRKAGKHERTSIIMLRRLGYTYNQLSSTFERSTSYIYRVCRKAMNLGTIAYADYREGISHQNKLRDSTRRMGIILCFFSQWTNFIDGVEDKPP